MGVVLTTQKTTSIKYIIMKNNLGGILLSLSPVTALCCWIGVATLLCPSHFWRCNFKTKFREHSILELATRDLEAAGAFFQDPL